MSEAKQDFTIGALARAAGVNVETIRFYQRRGLMPEPERPWGGIRRYARQDADRLRFIKSAQRLGFALDEVIELLRLEDGSHCEEARRLARPGWPTCAGAWRTWRAWRRPWRDWWIPAGA